MHIENPNKDNLMKRIFMVFLSVVLCLSHALCMGKDYFLSSPFLRYIENVTPAPVTESQKEVFNVISTYSVINDLLKDISLGLSSDNEIVQKNVLHFLMRTREIEKDIHCYEQIREFMRTPLICQRLRQINDESPLEANRLIIPPPNNRRQVMSVIRIYEIHPLFDVIFENANHKDPFIRRCVYFEIGYIGNFEKEKALACLRHGFEESGFYQLLGTYPVRKEAADACVRLGGEFHEMLLSYALANPQDTVLAQYLERVRMKDDLDVNKQITTTIKLRLICNCRVCSRNPTFVLLAVHRTVSTFSVRDFAKRHGTRLRVR